MKLLASVAVFASAAMAFSPAPLASYNRLSLRRAGMAIKNDDTGTDQDVIRVAVSRMIRCTELHARVDLCPECMMLQPALHSERKSFVLPRWF